MVCWQQLRFVEKPSGWGIENTPLKTSVEKYFLPAWILAAQHHRIDQFPIAINKRSNNPHPLMYWNFGINIEHVESIDLAAISSGSLVHRYQDFLIGQAAAK